MRQGLFAWSAAWHSRLQFRQADGQAVYLFITAPGMNIRICRGESVVGPRCEPDVEVL